MAALNPMLIVILAICLTFVANAEEQTVTNTEAADVQATTIPQADNVQAASTSQADDIQTISTPRIQPPARICVVSKLSGSCKQMEEDLPQTFVCVIGRDNMDCAEKIQKGVADISNMDAQAIYNAGRYFFLRPLATELVNGVPHRYQGIALVPSDLNISSLNDLKGLRSCHTGVGRTVGWQIPLGMLISKGVMTPDCIGELHTVASFFNGSCAAGPWVSDPSVDAELKKRYPSLCAQCHDPGTCSVSDSYGGYEGAIRCVADGSGDIAFTKVPAVRDYLKNNPSISQRLKLLCLNGTKKSLLDEEPCVWSTRPTNAFVVSPSISEEDRERLMSILNSVILRYPVPHVHAPDWLHKVFYSHPTVTGAQHVSPQRDTWDTYLGDFVSAIQRTRQTCNYTPLKFCVTSEIEREKCVDYSRAVDSRGIIPPVDCVLTSSKVACMVAIEQGYADIVTLDGGDVYKAGKYYDLKPVSAELYGDLDATYYAVAVLRSASDVEKLSQLSALRSCHTGIGRTAGWVVPVGALIDADLIPTHPCNRASGVAAFFSSSCVPGANDTKYNPGRVQAEKLCKRCVGDDNGEHRCARDSRERYSGYAGALRCLAEGAGDVAFVKHTTVSQYTDGKGGAQWSKDLLSSDFQLLCREGGRSQISDYRTCNLAKVPSHHVMTGGNATSLQRLKIAYFLAQSSKYFGDNSTFFTLFENYKSVPDLLFKDSTTDLKSVPLTATYIDVLGNEFYKASSNTDPKNCEES